MPSSVHGSGISRGVLTFFAIASAMWLVDCGDDSNSSGGTGGANVAGGQGHIGGQAGAGTSSTAGGMSSGGTSATAGVTANAGAAPVGGNVGSAGTAGQSSVSFATIYSSVVANRCLPCHATGNGALIGMLDMSTREAAYSHLVGASGQGVAAQGTSAGAAGVTCSSMSGLLRVDPGDAAASLLWRKVSSKLQGTNPPCGNPMPPGTAAALSQAEVDLVAAWINQGAMNN